MKNTFEINRLNGRLPIVKWGFSVFGFILLIIVTLIIGLVLSNFGGNMFSPNIELNACIKLIGHFK